MIIKYPTGLYRDVLPNSPQKSGSVTFTISNTTPPRTNLLFPKVPAGLVNKGREQAIPQSARRYYGELIYTTSSARRQNVGNNTKQFEIGQVLEFGNQDNGSVAPMLVSGTIEIQHNTNLLNYQDLGVSADEQQLIADQSAKTYIIVTDKLNGLRRDRADIEVSINTTRKIINETNRTIAALVAMDSSNTDVSDLIKKLRQKLSDANIRMGELIVQADALATEATVALDKLRAISLVVK